MKDKPLRGKVFNREIFPRFFRLQSASRFCGLIFEVKAPPITFMWICCLFFHSQRSSPASVQAAGSFFWDTHPVVPLTLFARYRHSNPCPLFISFCDFLQRRPSSPDMTSLGPDPPPVLVLHCRPFGFCRTLALAAPFFVAPWFFAFFCWASAFRRPLCGGRGSDRRGGPPLPFPLEFLPGPGTPLDRREL